MDYSSYLSVGLTCAILMLAIVALLVGALAIWGYRGLKDEASRIARREARKCVAALVKRGPMRDWLTEEIRKRVAMEADLVVAGLAYNTAARDKAAANDLPLAKPYPLAAGGDDGK